jgi:membrane protein
LSAVKGYSRTVWSRDRAALDGWGAVWTRFARIATWTIRGVRVHRLSMQAAALAYYTLFSIVPVLVVALWVLKVFHLLPHLQPEQAGPGLSAVSSEMNDGNANQVLRDAVRGILAAVDRTGRVQIGIVGLVALLYGVIKQIRHVETALNSIAGRRERSRKPGRRLGYLALLVLPPALLVVSGLLRSLSHLPVGETIANAISWLLAAAPLLKSALGPVIGLAILCAALTIFYASAMRARIALRSTILGAALGAVSLAVVLWAFARLQIGVSRIGALESGMAAIPVFLLWAFSSWLVILIGAQVAVAHELDGILIHGASSWRLDPYEEQMAGVQIIAETTRRELRARERGSIGAEGATANELARQLRLLPASVRDVAARLRAAGLLRQTDAGGYRLACDPDRTGLRDVVGAIIGRPVDGGATTGPRRTGPTLHELAERQAAG